MTEQSQKELGKTLWNIADAQRIADCLSALDIRIDAESGKLEVLKRHKKGLMQQLFPAPDRGTQ